MLTAKALGLQFQKGVYRFCATNIDGDIQSDSLQCTYSISHLMSVHGRSSFLGANFVCKPPLLLYGGALVYAWPDFHVSCHRWVLITLIFTFNFQEHIWTCSFNLISNFCVEIPIFNSGGLSPQNYWKKVKAFYTWFFVQHVIIPIGITFRNVSIGRENIPPFVSNWAVTRARASCGGIIAH